MSGGQILNQPVGGDLCSNLLVVICDLVGARKKNCTDATITTTMTTVAEIRAMEVIFGS